MSANYATAAVDDRSGVDTLEDLARQHPALVVVARVGWVAKGLVYALVGALALPIARDARRGAGNASQEASQSGAIAKIADTSAGSAALWAVAIGLVLYVLWRVVSILLPAENTAKVWATRVRLRRQRAHLHGPRVERDLVRDAQLVRADRELSSRAVSRAT